MLQKLDFWGGGESLVKTLLDDRKTLDELGVTYEQLASGVEDLLHNEKKYKKLKMTTMGTAGSQHCPWGDKNRCSCMISVQKKEDEAKTNLVLMENMKKMRESIGSGERVSPEWMLKTPYNIIFTEMSAHLIRDHKFFEGKGSPYRMAPKTLKEWLGL